jgi:hypothetical protein
MYMKLPKTFGVTFTITIFLPLIGLLSASDSVNLDLDCTPNFENTDSFNIGIFSNSTLLEMPTYLRQNLKRFPALFLSHGAPNQILQTKSSSYSFFKDLGKEIKRVHQKEGVPLRAILIVSAHWEEPIVSLTAS